MNRKVWVVLVISLILAVALVLPACSQPAPAPKPSAPGATTPPHRSQPRHLNSVIPCLKLLQWEEGMIGSDLSLKSAPRGATR